MRDPETQIPLIKEYTLNYKRNPKIGFKVYSLTKGFWSLWVPAIEVQFTYKDTAADFPAIFRVHCF